MKMTMGNRIGFEFSDTFDRSLLSGYLYGSFIIETEGDAVPEGAVKIGRTVSGPYISLGSEK